MIGFCIKAYTLLWLGAELAQVIARTLCGSVLLFGISQAFRVENWCAAGTMFRESFIRQLR